ncbi:MAG TPA: PadR family transcriptional regulator [Parvularculaceae bacterium]|nr:PadR family transcriptional regulator [Parvularculaceae bacterium]
MARNETSGFLGNWTSQARKGFLELVVMASLGQREFYGYELVQHIKARGGIEVGDGTLYAILARLQRDGFIRHRWEHLDKGPARKYYALTREGRAALKGMRSVWDAMTSAIDGANHV